MVLDMRPRHHERVDSLGVRVVLDLHYGINVQFGNSLLSSTVKFRKHIQGFYIVEGVGEVLHGFLVICLHHSLELGLEEFLQRCMPT